MRYIYIAGPLRSSGDFELNVAQAIDVAEELRKKGLYPYIAHTANNVLWTMMHPRTHEESMQLDFAWIKRCDAVLALPGESRGKDREIEFAYANDIPVFLSIPSLLNAAESARSS